MSEDRRTDGRHVPRRGGFRADIQGMRALAVLAIIAFHAGISPYPGGFVTLDVFFVISGFLITHLLVREVQHTGTLSLRGFYRRRALRILPAASVAAVATVVGSWLWLDLVAAKDAAVDALWAAVFAANIRFAQESTDYFAADQSPSPFQHFWSLSLEEQFYAGLPLMLVGCILLAAWLHRRGIASTADPRRAMLVALVVTTAASFAWSLHASTASPDTAYFSTFTRVWEFGVGAILAITAPRMVRTFTHRARNLVALTGLGAIALGAFVVTPATPYPGHMALLPVLGTGAVMVAGAGLGDRRPPLVQRALGVAPMRFIGDASYSLYLWHWPVLIVATARLGRDLTATELAGLLAVTFALALASHRWVEQPFRRGNPLRFRSDLSLYPVAVALVASYSLVAVALVHHHADTGGEPIRTADYDAHLKGQQLDRDPAIALVEASARAAAENKEIPADLTPGLLDLADDQADVGDCDYRDDGSWELCARGAADADRTIVVLGNSHGRHWIPAFEAIATRTGHTAHYLVRPGCSAARTAPPEAGTPGLPCLEFNAWARQQVARLQPDLTVISTTAPGAVVRDGTATSDPGHVREEFRAGIANLIDDVQPHSDELVVLGDTPRRQQHAAGCLSQRDARLGDCSDPPAPKAARDTAASRAVAKEHGVRFIDTTPWFCADGRCPAVIGSTVVMRDFSHVTTAYAAQLAEPLRKALRLTPTGK